MNHYMWASFWSETSIDLTNGCWVWHGPRQSPGRGRFHVQRQDWPVQFVPWVGHGLTPENVLASCGSPDCVRPAHQALLTLDDPSDLRRQVELLSHCPAGHPHAGGAYRVVDKMNQGVFESGCRTCWERA